MQLLFVSIITLVASISIIFWGYRIFLKLLPIRSLFTGIWLGGELFSSFLGGGLLVTAASWIFRIVVGLLFAVFSIIALKIAVPLFAASIDFHTAIVGANGLFLSLMVIFNRLTIGTLQAPDFSFVAALQRTWPWSLLWFVVLVGGIVFQIRENRSETGQEIGVGDEPI